jgi:GrpB-like predicted nucleotidyltransferase (UPF0157 family)
MDSEESSSIRPGWDTGDWSGMPPVAIHPYDARWPDQYERFRSEIAGALEGLDVAVEHIGSTAVPGLSARRGIDIMLGLANPADLPAMVERLQGLGFEHHFSEPEWTHLSGRGCKLHLRPLGSTGWSDHLLFRDYLRRHPDARDAYQQVKHDLIQAYGVDGHRYVDGKTAIVRSILERARAEHDAAGDSTAEAPTS